jgi:predicted aspartyl protease
MGTFKVRRWESLEAVVADGRRLECDVAEASIRIDGRQRHAVVVFGQEGAQPLLGAVTLEGLRLAPDAATHRLIRAPGLLQGERA